ncbi:bifunctional folylpolyglutamate synthase/dihydrofolate synthase [Puteibacter caeruleilacunae]|nr:bifunctional folylpolyglutamate synthase/dihydrofolate synthase [Puteibacter caeruleilacunae]
MNYKETLEFLFEQLPMYQRQGAAAYKNDLGNTLVLDELFNHPHESFKTIHIAGTNGKGSVSHMLASVLQEAGLKVGLYTSPHLKDYRERIRVNGDPVSEDFVVNFVTDFKNSDAAKEISPSFFEFTVAMAFDYFRHSKVDVAVVEVGLGGRLDSTNIITPELSVITNISLDHTALLGNKVEVIAKEKAGIIKSEVPVVIGETQELTASVFNDFAARNNAPIIFADQQLQVEYSMKDLDGCQVIHFKNLSTDEHLQVGLDLLGIYQQKNVLTALCAIEQLRNAEWQITDENISTGLRCVKRNTGMCGRWQEIGWNPLIICDTGHNEAGVKNIVEQINQTPHQKLHMVIGVVNDKNVDGILELLPKDAEYYFTRASIPRALDQELLQEQAAKFELCGKTYADVSEALKAASNNSNEKDLIFVGGSTFVVAEVL